MKTALGSPNDKSIRKARLEWIAMVMKDRLLEVPNLIRKVAQ